MNVTQPDDATTAPVVDYATMYAGLGLRVLPIRPGAKTPSLTAWTDAATTDTTIIAEWWGGLYRGHGIGIALDQLPDGRWAFAVDIDGASHNVDGATTWHDLCATYPNHPPAETVEATTGGGGTHLLFAAPHEVRNGTIGPKGGGIDIRGKGGQILAEPTLHPNGTAYSWVDGHEPWNMAIADAPGWLVAMLDEPERVAPSPNVPQAPATGDRPGDLWAASTSWEEILTADGWTLHHTDRQTGELHWTRPGKERRDGTSATTGFTTNDNLKVFTSSVPALDAEATYSKLGYLAATRFGGDHAAAASHLAGLGHHVDQAPVDLSWTPSGLPPAAPGALLGDGTDLHGWEPTDLAAILAGDYEAPVPTIGRRTDGRALFYPGRVNAIQGESGSGKSWVAIWAAAAELAQGNHVLYIDLEDHAASMIARLRAVGVADGAIASAFHYINPARSWNHAGSVELERICTEHPVTLAVIDSTGEAMALDGAKPNDDDDTARWFRRVPRALASHGPAVVITDHLPKATDAPSLFAIGSQRKRAAIDGVAYRCDVRVAPSRGGEGHLGLICAKDRNGTYQQGTKIADVHVLSTDEVTGSVQITVTSPEGYHRPTVLMQRVSEYLEAQDEPVSKRQICKDVKGKEQPLRIAVDLLVMEGWTRSVPRPGRGGGDGYEVVTPYRDDSVKEWSPEGADPVENLVHDTFQTPENGTATPATQPRPGGRGRGSEPVDDEPRPPRPLPSVNRQGRGRGSASSDDLLDSSTDEPRPPVETTTTNGAHDDLLF